MQNVLRFEQIHFNVEKEIDWNNTFNYDALNLSTMQFERTSMIGPKSNIVISLEDSIADYSEDIAEIAKANNATFLLYYYYYVVGYVVEFE